MLPITIKDLHKAFLEANSDICTDTRKITKGGIFFCLKGDNFNGNLFALKAIELGCKFAVVDELEYVTSDKILFVQDVLKALQALANYHRKLFSIPIIGITGSNGKTSHKEFIHAVLSAKYKTLATEGNLNNHIGVPLTLLKLRADHEIAIIEMGANHQGEIKELCEISEPNYGLITNIGKAHLEGFGGIEGVKKGKGEMYRFMEKNKGKIFLNGDDLVLQEIIGSNEKITYGVGKIYDVIGKEIFMNEFVNFKWTTKYGEKDWSKLPTIETNIIGHYNFVNLICAVCIGNYFKVEAESINKALSAYTPNMNRSQLEKTKSNILILDAYNANPSSMKVAIENFANLEAPNKAIIIGDMFELGEYASEEHLKIINLLKDLKLTDVILVGKEFSKINNSQFNSFETTSQVLAYLKANALKNKTILIKGSRGMKLETLKEAL